MKSMVSINIQKVLRKKKKRKITVIGRMILINLNIIIGEGNVVKAGGKIC